LFVSPLPCDYGLGKFDRTGGHSVAKKYRPPLKHKVKKRIKNAITTIKPVIVHHTGAGITQLECPYGASEAFRTSGMAMIMKRRHENKWRHKKKLCRLFKGM
jgi:hypothetical protein